MKNVRLVVNIQKEDTNYTLENLKVVVEDRAEGTQLSSVRSYGSVFTNPTLLFAEIQTRATEVLTSILNN